MGFRREWYEDDRSGGGGGGFAFSGGGFGGTSITKTLIIAMFVVFGIQVITFAATRQDVLGDYLGLRSSNSFFVLPLVSYMFLHSVGSPFHILFNALALFFFGRELEAALGPRRFLTVYFGAGIAGGIAYVIGQSVAGGDIPVIGASGGVLGIIVLYAFMYPHRQVIFILFPMKIWVLAAVLVGVDIYSTLLGSSGQVATLAHLGGAAWGALMFYWRTDFFGWADDARQKMRENREKREVEVRRNQDEEMDRILKKIHDQGLPSLTSQEKKFIEGMSREKRNQRR